MLTSISSSTIVKKHQLCLTPITYTRPYHSGRSTRLIHLSNTRITKAFPVTPLTMLTFITRVNNYFALISKQNVLPVITSPLSMCSCPVLTSHTMTSCQARTIAQPPATYAGISKPTSDSLRAYPGSIASRCFIGSFSCRAKSTSQVP